MQVNDREWSGQPRVTWDQIYELVFSNKMCVSEPVCSPDSQNVIFISMRGLEMFEIAVLKWCHRQIRFLGYMFAKYKCINLKFGMPDVQLWLYNM